MLQHMENCNHTAALMSSAKLILQELPGNSPTTVKYIWYSIQEEFGATNTQTTGTILQ